MSFATEKTRDELLAKAGAPAIAAAIRAGATERPQ